MWPVPRTSSVLVRLANVRMHAVFTPKPRPLTRLHGGYLETRVLALEALPFEPKLTKVSAPQARLLAARAAKSSKRLRVPTEPAPYLQTTP